MAPIKFVRGLLFRIIVAVVGIVLLIQTSCPIMCSLPFLKAMVGR
jgi:hypothetical protein